MIRVVDYGVGNIQAFLTIFKGLGKDAKRASLPSELTDATHLVLPGVGHFDHAIRRLNDSGLRPRLDSLVLDMKIPVLGICVGMQMLAGRSDEGILPGLNWIPGTVRSFSSSFNGTRLPLPHMGWNIVTPVSGSSLFYSENDDPHQLYFLHSYYFEALEKINVAAKANYGFDFDVAVSRDNIHGVQFHPEKSHHWGVQILKNFVEL